MPSITSTSSCWPRSSADPRATVVALAERLGLSRNTVQARMARLERSGVFLSYERAISSSALGFPIEAFISVIVRQADLPAHHRRAGPRPRDRAGARPVSGQVDLLVRVACRDTQHLFDTDARILAIEGVERTETSLVMGEVISSPRGAAHGAGAAAAVAALARGLRGRTRHPARTSTTPTRISAPPTNWIGAGTSPRKSHANPSANSTSDSPTNDATREPMRGTAMTPNA